MTVIMVDLSQRRSPVNRPVRGSTEARNHEMTSRADDAGANESPDPVPAIEMGQEGQLSWWRVGGHRVEMFPTARGWEARVCGPGWGDATLDLDGLFTSEDEARD
jgi:hypothetical protein